jgi:hypothetical protein
VRFDREDIIGSPFPSWAAMSLAGAAGFVRYRRQLPVRHRVRLTGVTRPAWSAVAYRRT